jgi:hypothetical protein
MRAGRPRRGPVCGAGLCAFLLAASAGAEPLPAGETGKTAASPTAPGSRLPAVRSTLRVSPQSLSEPSLPGADPSTPAPALQLPSPAHLLAPTEAEAKLDLAARYLPPVLAEPDRPAGDRRWEADLPTSQRDMLAGPMVHPAARSTVSDVCPAPPDPGWLIELKAQWAQYRYGNAEPMAGQASYLPFRCY